MSGHSKWAKLKHKKGDIDAKRGKIFSKIIKEITVSTRMGGDDPATNPRLRLAIQKAKEANMPGKNVDNAILRGAGKDESISYEEITYEGVGPGGVGLMITCLTDNKNRSVSDVRSTLTKNGATMGSAGSVSWQFEKKGLINIEKSAQPDEEKMMELALEAGAEDVVVEEEGYTVKTDIPSFVTVLEKLKASGVTVAESNLDFWPKQTVPVDDAVAEKLADLVALIDDLDDVQSVASNEASG
ncbi:MAG: YebC/PmpR family DNA-binding transcriptional regulator [Spirochaetes bacterium]|nr:YebC/PmpR family DNA-binding transcriptional regulator [Spirochaetota bacterium]